MMWNRTLPRPSSPGSRGHDLIGADVAETLVAGIERHDFIGSDVAETLVVWFESHLGHA